MRKHLTILIAVFLMSASIVSAQITSSPMDEFLNGGKKTSVIPFDNIRDYLVKNNREFGNDEQTVKLFNEERGRLGANFENELWKYLGDSPVKHYWASLFLNSDDYLQGNQPLPQLAFKIWEKGSEIVVTDGDIQGLGYKYNILREMAINLYLQGNRDLAIAKKRKAQSLFNAIKDYGLVNAIDDYSLCIFDNLEKKPQKCKPEKPTENNQPTANNSGSNIVSGGVLNGKAVNMPVPDYPASAKAVGATGTVNVSVVVNENGDVTSANATSGHPLLKEAAIKAAKQAKFQPFLQSGKAVKVIGIIVYNFN